MENGLVLATVVIPAYAGLVHGWIFVQRQRETMHLWLALVALALAVIAAALIAHGNAAGIEEARFWQSLQLGAGVPLAIGFVHFILAFLERRRPRVERATWILAAAVAVGFAGDWIFERVGVVRPVLMFHPPVLEAALTPYGEVALAGFVFFVGYLGVELALAWRRRPDTRAVSLAYAAFAITLLHDSARGARWIEGPELLTVGYLVMVVGISAALIRRFVRSMAEAERLATDLHDRVEERSAELRRKEVQLIHGERLATLGTLAAGVAHEINDPMAFVSSNLNRVEEIWNDPRERSEVPEILAECREGVARLRGTVSELLRLARGSEAENLPVDLAAVVASVLPLVRGEARYRADLACQLEPVPPVSGNPGLLAQVALQLLLSGVRAAPGAGATRHRVHVSTACEEGWVLLRVRDDGPPFPAELLPTLFHPFAAAADARGPGEPRGGGTRLGLAVTHQIVRQHGGDIRVESSDSCTEIVVALPVAEPPGAAQRVVP